MAINTALPTEETAREVQRSAEDPQVEMTIVEYGLVNRIEVALEQVHIEMTMTTPAWLLGHLVIDNARHAFGALLPQGADVDIGFVWEPTWMRGLMPVGAKQTIGWPT